MLEHLEVVEHRWQGQGSNPPLVAGAGGADGGFLGDITSHHLMEHQDQMAVEDIHKIRWWWRWE